MKQLKVFISGADRGLGLSLTEKLLKRGHLVYAGQFMPDWPALDQLKLTFPESLQIIPLDVGCDENVKEAACKIKELSDRIDVLICNAGIIGWDDELVEGPTDTKMMLDVYNVNAVGSVRLVEQCLPLLMNGDERKICFVSSEAGSVSNCERDSFFWYGMSKSAMNLYAKTMFNRLRPQNFKFRLYDPGWMKTYMHGELNERATYTPEEAATFAVDYFFDQTVEEDELVLHIYDGRTSAF